MLPTLIFDSVFLWPVHTAQPRFGCDGYRLALPGLPAHPEG